MDLKVVDQHRFQHIYRRRQGIWQSASGDPADVKSVGLAGSVPGRELAGWLAADPSRHSPSAALDIASFRPSRVARLLHLNPLSLRDISLPGRMRPSLRSRPATPLLRCLRHLADAPPRRLMPPAATFLGRPALRRPLIKLAGVASANPCPPSDTSEGGARAVRRGRDEANIAAAPQRGRRRAGRSGAMSVAREPRGSSGGRAPAEVSSPTEISGRTATSFPCAKTRDFAHGRSQNGLAVCGEGQLRTRWRGRSGINREIGVKKARFFTPIVVFKRVCVRIGLILTRNLRQP